MLRLFKGDPVCGATNELPERRLAVRHNPAACVDVRVSKAALSISAALLSVSVNTSVSVWDVTEAG